MIFLTGATGFLGSHLLHELALNDQPVRALYRDRENLAYVSRIFQYYTSDARDLMNKIEWAQGDILDYYSLVEQLRGIDLVYHCAGMVSFNKADNQKMFNTNVKGTAHIVDACLEHKMARLCHVSSISALGNSQDGEPIGENHLWNQESSASPYSFSKFRSEMEVWRGIHEGLDAVIVNPSVILGPGMWLRSGGVLYQQIYNGLNYYPTGASGFVDVRDVVRVMIRLANSNIKSERFIVSSENKTHKEIINLLAGGMNLPGPARPLTPLLARLVCNFEKIRSVVTGKPVRINKRSIQSATANYAYSNQKITETLSFDFIPVKDSVALSSSLFLGDQKT